MTERILERLDLNHGDQAGPKYERLKAKLLSELQNGQLKPGQLMPSEDVLADTLQVARSTVRQALADLQRSGLIYRVRGVGTFVDKHVRQRLRKGLDIFALVLPSTRSGFYPSLQYGFEGVCKTAHHQMIVCCSENDLDKQGNILMQLMDREVGGVAIVPAPCAPTPAYQIRQLRQRGIPVVLCHRGVEGIQAPRLSIPFRRVGEMAGEALAARGHRLVAYVVPGKPTDAAEAYEDGLRKAMLQAGGNVRRVPVPGATHADAAQPEQEILAALRQLFSESDRPTAIMTSFDSMSELVYLLLGQLGLRVPDDVSLIGFGGSWRESAMLRRLTAVTVDEGDLGRRAAQLLHEMRSGDRPMDDAEEVVMSLNLFEGQSLGPATRPN